MVEHPQWGTRALPMRAELYVRQKDLPKIPAERRPKFRTKLEQAAEMIEWAASSLEFKGKSIWLAVDGGYAKREVIQATIGGETIAFLRLLLDANRCGRRQLERKLDAVARGEGFSMVFSMERLTRSREPRPIARESVSTMPPKRIPKASSTMLPPICR